ncbi:MAG: N-acetyl-D-Glu racemase DgcA [Pseudomonadota bacterium]|jgi:L-alanine-DL-glutamate epimerase-like enolase superfamily enzyme
MDLEVRIAQWDLATPLRISNSVFPCAKTIVVEIRDGNLRGRGESNGIFYRGETVDTLVRSVEAVRPALERGISRDALCALMPAGGARNAIDCALWDLESKRTSTRAWVLAGLPTVRPLTTAYTIGVGTPEAMAASARVAATRQLDLLKLKLAGAGDLERVRAVRAAHPQARIIVDANQGWSEHHVHEYPAELARLGVSLIEQPLPVGQDAVLREVDSPIPFCADESCQASDSLGGLVGKYQWVNLKLDKTGGLTEALRMVSIARSLDMRVMVGCMLGTSLAIAPAFVLGQRCDLADLDAPLLLANDRAEGIRYDGNQVHSPRPSLWG